MRNICRDLFKAIYEDKWISIEYVNKNKETTKYWIGIKEIHLGKNVTLTVDGLHLVQGSVTELNILLDSITFSCVLDGSYYAVNPKLKEDIEQNPEKYETLFDNVANLKILNYLSDCNRLDNVPLKKDYALIEQIDDDKVKNGDYSLSDAQYLEIIRSFQSANKMKNRRNSLQLCLNILSIHSKKGLYVLAYRDLNFDVINHCFRAEEQIHICDEFNVNGEYIASVRYFLDGEETYLLNDFMANLEVIEDRIIENGNGKYTVDDVPYVIAISREMPVSLEEDYRYIQGRMVQDDAAVPLKAFFGELVKEPRRIKNYPMTLLNKKVNLDQLLAIHHAIKYPITYVQGPPGTGKTNTIINTILTAFFNEKTVLFTSYNNHPIDGVMDKLTSIKYNNQPIPFPILRIGNNEKMLEALTYIKAIYDYAKAIEIPEEAYNQYITTLKSDSSKLTELMVRYEEIIDLKERKETIEKLLDSSDDFNFQLELQSKQLNDIKNRLNEIGEVTNEEALDLVVEDELFKKVLYYMSASYIQRLNEPKYASLLDLCEIEDEQQRALEFNRYIEKPENLVKLMRVFPIIATTCISAHKLGKPDGYFDLTIMDEASQCNSAIALIPILRGANLLLVGDPQQLNPVIQLQAKDNEILKKKYRITSEYDYTENSIYKTFLAADSISQEILLSHHYRCDKKIIDFCNQKYYNNKLTVKTDAGKQPLLFIDVKDNKSAIKNTSLKEVDAIVDYVQKHPERSIGIITPFVNQKKAIEEALKNNGIVDVSCGTVHAFQGDEKDEIIFSLALTDKTSPKTYDWLKNNKELINVGVSRARKKLVLLASKDEIRRLHSHDPFQRDDIYELAQYAVSNGLSKISKVENKSRALGIKPYSSEIEEAFLISLNHALGNILKSDEKCTIKKEVAIAAVFADNPSYNPLFYNGRFDFVVYQRQLGEELPLLAIELDGKEHRSDEAVRQRDEKKNQICKEHGFELIRIENIYARRYNYIKDILIDYFAN